MPKFADGTKRLAMAEQSKIVITMSGTQTPAKPDPQMDTQLETPRHVIIGKSHDRVCASQSQLVFH